jgi:hypothetical protein
MTLDAALWARLEDHGITVAHLELLLRLLELQRNGSLAWHFAHGQVSTCDMRLTFPSRRFEVSQVNTVLCQGVP